MADIPLARWQIVRTTDVHVAQQRVSEIFTEHRIRPIGTYHRLDAQVNSRHLLDTAIAALRYGQQVEIDPIEPRPFFVVLVPLAGSALIRLGEHELSLSPRLAALISATDAVRMRWSDDCAQLALRIDRTALESRLSELLTRRLHEPLRFMPGMDTTRGVGHWLRSTLRQLINELDRPSTIIDQPLIWQAFEETFLTGLLVTQPHNYTDALKEHAKDSAPTREMSAAIGLLVAHPEWEHSLTSIARHVGASPRSLQRAFKAQDTSFRERLTEIRLTRIRCDLLTTPQDTSTAGEICARWGIVHNGRTVAAYRDRYGETPHDTLTR